MDQPDLRPVWFEDFSAGTVYPLGEVVVTADEIVEFASRYDPQRFHVDEEAARSSAFGGLIASGWHTVCLFMRLYVDGVQGASQAIGSPGGDEIRWFAPVRPGDRLRGRCTIEAVKPSAKDPGRGSVTVLGEMLDDDRVVMRVRTISLIRRRPGDAVDDAATTGS